MADLAAQMAVVRGIRESFPSQLIIAEEDSTSLQDASICSEISAILAPFGVPVQRLPVSTCSSVLV